MIAANALAEGSLKLIVFKDRAGWSEIILARPAAYTEARYATGFRLRTVPCDSRVDRLHTVKSLNHLPNLLAKRGAVAAGFDEALWLDPRGQVLEGATTNVFVVKGGVVSTPPVESKILPGVMRAEVIRLIGPSSVRERVVLLDELLQADEVFVTNALLGIMPVAQVDATVYGHCGHTLARAWMKALAQRFEER